MGIRIINDWKQRRKIPRLDNALAQARELGVSLKTISRCFGLDIEGIPDDGMPDDTGSPTANMADKTQSVPKKEQAQSPKNMPALQRLREEVGLTQAQLAKKIPDKSKKKTLHQSAISRWESGEDQPELTIPQIKALCRALGKTLDELPDDLGPPKPLLADNEDEEDL